MKKTADILKNITLLGQFSLSLVTPLLLCLAACWWLTAHTGLGGWIYIVGFFFGLGGSGMFAYKFYLSVINKDKKDKTDKEKVSFNRHL
ncbi:MAG: AtpZ/AtpI family protein [Lachnospiraceae bacterium]|nr:AtpZ/AtpI family protein [Lachnospiraceae bacterium]